ncbi:MAG TPA: hypothetical protein VF432_09340 [Thermoanaerobaculia bacterium]
MTTFAAVASSLEAKAPDATKHVNYSLGMVLGVDDFNQEFAYLAGRDRWLARDAIGYGTLSGLALRIDTVGSQGPRLTVTSGSALTPRGQLVCVKPNQCAYLNQWLAANADKVAPLLGSPLAGTIDLYLTLCYRDCPVDLVPIPGAPCRSEDELMAPSRLVDDFSLELRTTPPDQSEEDVLRQFVNWLRTLTFGGGGPFLTPEEFEAQIKAALQVVVTPSSPLSSPPGGGASLILLSPLGSMDLDEALAPEYYRAAFRVWIQELRPKVHAVCGCSGGCCGGAKDADEPPKPDECLLLARISVPVVLSSGTWRVNETGTVEIDESRRPMLLHLRMLQELLVTAPAAGTVTSSSMPAGPVVVAAGHVAVDSAVSPVFGNLAMFFHAANTVRLTFDGYDSTRNYIVKAIASRTGALPLPVANPNITFDSADPAGLLLRVLNGAAATTESRIRDMRFMIEISEIG